MVDVSTLIAGIVALVIGIILYVVYPTIEGRIKKALKIGGEILIIIGIALIVIAILLPIILTI